MARISTYTANPIPQLDDKLIGTRVTGLPENNTMNFTLQAVFDLFVASGGSSLNIYNSDGTLNGNRFVTMGDYSLSFEKDLIVNTLTIGKGGGNIATNTAFGQNSLYSNTVGATNTSIGYASMYSNITGVDNTSVGSLSLFNNFGGIRNTSLGAYSLYSNIEGSSNVSVGWGSMYWNNEGNYNTSIGVYSLNLNEFGEGNVSIGYRSLVENVTGSNNVSVGYESMSTNTVGIDNVSLGSYSLYSLYIGDRNVSIGADSSNYLTIGYYNIGIGWRSLFNLTEGNENIGIGGNTTLFNDLDSNSIVIGHNAVGLGSNTIVFGNTSITTTILRGNIGIGTTTPSYILDVVGSDSRFNSVIVGKGYNDIAGNISIGDTRIGGVSLINSGNYNLAIGSKVMRRLTTGRANASIGGESMQDVTTGSYNSAMGVQGLFSVTTGGYNSSLGYFSNGLNTTGTYNVTLGAYSATDSTGGLGLISGSYNIFLGASNYAGITTGSYNVIIGSQVTGLPSSTANNIVIADGQGNIRFRDNGVDTILSRLVGTGTRMVVANAAGELSTQAIVTGGVTGSGTTNYVPKWTSSSAIGNSLIFDNGVGVGIGTNSADFTTYKLNVNGNVYASGFINTNTLFAITTATNEIKPQYPNPILAFNTTGGSRSLTMYDSSGDIFIGTTPVQNGYKLTVGGTSLFTDTLLINKTTDAIFRLRGGPYSGQYDTTIRAMSGAQGILQLGNNDINYIIAGNNTAGGYLVFRINATGENITSGTEAMRISPNGNLLIGRITEVNTTYKLQIGGSTIISGSLSVGPAANYGPFIGGILADQAASRFLEINILQAGKLSFNDGNAYIKGGSEGGTDFISFFTQNTNRIFISNGGNVSIGSSIDNGYKLYVNGTGWFNSDLYIRKPSNITCYAYIGDATNSYSLLEFRQTTNFYTIGAKPGGGFSFTNGFNNNDVFSLFSDATITLTIGAGNRANFSGKVAIGGYTNIYTLPNMLTVIGNTSIGTTEALSTANPTSVLFSVNSITQGVTPLPRMTNAQILAIASPISGLMVYNTTIEAPCFYDSTAAVPRWERLSHSAM